MSPDTVFGQLQGAWSFERTVTDQAQITGSAMVTALNWQTALYEEHAEVLLADGRRIRGQQRYIYRAADAGFDIFFHDAAVLFHAVRFTNAGSGILRAEARHECAADLYLSSYSVMSDDRFEVSHIVRGPRKAYTIATTYRRMDYTLSSSNPRKLPSSRPKRSEVERPLDFVLAVACPYSIT